LFGCFHFTPFPCFSEFPNNNLAAKYQHFSEDRPISMVVVYISTSNMKHLALLRQLHIVGCAVPYLTL
jgi:hypothetical protein